MRSGGPVVSRMSACIVAMHECGNVQSRRLTPAWLGLQSRLKETTGREEIRQSLGRNIGAGLVMRSAFRGDVSTVPRPPSL